MIERPQWYRPSAAARAPALLCCLKRCLGSLLADARGRRARPTHLAGSNCLLCLMHESNFEMLVCLVYASQRHAARVTGRWAAGRTLARLLDGRLSCQQHLFAAVSLTSPQSLLEAATAGHTQYIERPQRCAGRHLLTRRPPLITSDNTRRRNDVQRFRDGPVHKRVVRGLRVACRAAGAAARMVGLRP